MRNTETMKRYGLLVVSLFFSALGVALTKHGGLGVSPISSVANVMSLRLPTLSLGTWLIIWNCLLILGQVLVLRRQFRLVQLLQIPLSFLFGWFTDFGMWLASSIPAEHYPVRLGLVLAGMIVLSFGVSLSVIANVVMNSGEAFVKAVADTTHQAFGNVKVGFDVTCVVIALLLSLLFFDFTVVGTREGTVITALLTGVVVKFFDSKLREPLEAFLCGMQTA